MPSLILPTLRTDQATILRHSAQVKVVCTGRRWGKTVMGGTYALLCARRGASVAWIVPTYRNSRPLWRFCQQRTVAVADRLRINRSEMVIEFPGGGRLGVYTADNDNAIRGEAFHVAIVDEAPLVRPETYTDVIMPTLADHNGSCLLIGTPKGRNWFYQEFQRGVQDGRQQAAFTAPTSANPLPNIQRAFRLARERVSERTFRQEWLAEFLDSSGLVFRFVDEAATLQAQAEPVEGHVYVGGIDWARSNDYTVFAVLDSTTKELAYLDRMTDTDYDLQRRRLVALHHRFGVRSWVGEYNSMGGPMVEMLQNAGLPVEPFTTTNATKAQVIDALSLAFEQRTLRVLADAVLVSELKGYEGDRLPSGMMRYGAPAGLHDDTVIALALAWYGATAHVLDGQLMY